MGHPAASAFPHAGIPHLRHADAAWMRPSPSRRLIQATVAKLYKLLRSESGFRYYRRALIMENKWRAAALRAGRQADRFRKAEIEVPVRELIIEYLRIRRRCRGRVG